MSHDPSKLMVDDAPHACTTCKAALCLRKQVVNLALGNTDQMFCLSCLGKQNEQPPAELLARLITYIEGRQCFAKEWQRYSDVSFCPDRAGCLPDICFNTDLGV